jgi:hypothetical protein
MDLVSPHATDYHCGPMQTRVRGLVGAALLLCAFCTFSALPVKAVQCAIDQVPAATLLMPYFEVDLSNGSNVTSLLAMTNTAATATLTHVTIWTDWGVPALGFDVYFTGYDTQTINLRDVIGSGLIPRTASVGQDPFNTISPRGPRSQDINIPSCNGILPPANLDAAALADLKAKLKGEPIPSSPTLCAGSPRGNQIARGYVTVDVVTGCTALNPSSAGYFSGIASNNNVLVGEMLINALGTNTMWAYPLIHLEAATLAPSSPSFYGRYVGDSGTDGREPLPASYATRFVGPSPTNSSRLLVWRETPAMSGPVACAGGPAWVPLQTTALQLLDEATHAFPAAASLPVAANAIDLAADVANPFTQGLAILQLDHPAMGSRHAQAAVLAAHGLGTLESAFPASQLDDLCANQRYLPLLIDGFENGFVPWAGKTP